MRSILVAFSCVLLSSVYGQKKQDYAWYHDRILEIEELNAREQFDSSLTLYYNVFSQYNRVLVRDAYNACQLAALQNAKQFPQFFYTCARSGISRNKLLAHPLIHSRYIADSTHLNKLYNQGIREYSRRIDLTLRNEMLQRYENEQKNKGKANYLQVCSDNFNRILELSRQGKFPGEDRIGTDDDLQSIILPTLCHYPYSYTLLEPYFTDALKGGKVTPVSLIYLYGFNQTRTSILYTSEIPTDTLHFNIAYNLPFGKQSDDVNEVNRQRALKKVYSLSVQKGLKMTMRKYGIDYHMGY